MWHVKDSGLVTKIQKAAIKGDLGSFKKYIDEWKKELGIDSDVPAIQEKYQFMLNALLNNTQDSLLMYLMTKNEECKDVILEILNEFEKASLDYLPLLTTYGMFKIHVNFPNEIIPKHIEGIRDTLYMGNIPVVPRYLYEWACANKADDILTHPIVVRLKEYSHVQDCILQGHLDEARTHANKVNIPYGVWLNSSLVLAAIHSIIPGKSLSWNVNPLKLLSEMVENLDVGPCTLVHHEMIRTQSDYVDALFYNPLLEGTKAIELLKTIRDLRNPNYVGQNDFNRLAVLIRDYLENCRTDEQLRVISTDLFGLLTHTYPPLDTSEPRLNEEKKEILESILTNLLDKGAMFPKISLTYSESYMAFIMSTMMYSVINHPAYKKHLITSQGFSPYPCQAVFDDISMCLSWGESHLKTIDMILSTVESINGFISLPDNPKEFYGENVCVFEFNDEIHKLCDNRGAPISLKNLTLPENAEKKKRFEDLLEFAGMLLKYNLVHNKKEIKPGAKSLSIDNPETGEKYDLFQFIMDNPCLKSGWHYSDRKNELMLNYAWAKAMAQPQIAEVGIERLLQRLPSDLQDSIFARVTPGEGLTIEDKRNTQSKLRQIARETVAKEEIKSKKPKH